MNIQMSWGSAFWQDLSRNNQRRGNKHTSFHTAGRKHNCNWQPQQPLLHLDVRDSSSSSSQCLLLWSSSPLSSSWRQVRCVVPRCQLHCWQFQHFSQGGRRGRRRSYNKHLMGVILPSYCPSSSRTDPLLFRRWLRLLPQSRRRILLPLSLDGRCLPDGTTLPPPAVAYLEGGRCDLCFHCMDVPPRRNWCFLSPYIVLWGVLLLSLNIFYLLV